MPSMMDRSMFQGGQAPAPDAEQGIAGLSAQIKNQAQQGLAQAQNPEQAINAMRGNQQPLEARYAELAQFVGPQDAQATPPMVLTMVQPAILLGESGGGVEGLMPQVAGEAPAPGGIGELMPQAAPPQQPPQPVQQFEEGGRVKKYYDQDYADYLDILQPTEADKTASKRNLWFDVARRGLSMAAGTNPDTGREVTGRNTAGRLADAFATMPTAYAQEKDRMETGPQRAAQQAALQSISDRMKAENQATLRGRFSNSPVYTRNEDGTIGLAQTSNTGDIRHSSAPEGLEYLLPGAIAGFDPTNIARRGEADIEVAVDEINATSTPAAEAARELERAAQEARLSVQRTFEAGGVKAKMDGTVRTAENTIKAIDNVLEGKNEEGVEIATGLSSLLDPRSWVPGQKGADVARLVDVLENRIFVDTLQSIRENSQTGGAVGSVSDREGERMANMQGSLSRAQSYEQFIDQLNIIREILTETVGGYEAAFETQYGQYLPKEDEAGDTDINDLLNSVLGPED